MKFAELHQKLAFNYPSRISIIYPNTLNGNLLSYMFADNPTIDLLEVKFLDGKMTVTETVDGVATVTESTEDVFALKELCREYYFKRNAA